MCLQFQILSYLYFKSALFSAFMYSGNSDTMEDDYECTVPLDDTVALDVTDSVDNKRIQKSDENEGEIVCDSDEGADETQDVGAMNKLPCRKIVTRQHNRTGFLRRNTRKDFVQSVRPTNIENQVLVDNQSFEIKSAKEFESTEKETLSKDVHDMNKVMSTTSYEAINGENETSPVASDNKYMQSQEPGESSESSALEFVDRYLSSTNLLIQEEEASITKSNKVKYTPLLNAKGPRTLAKKASLLTAMKSGAFDWDDEQAEREESLSIRKGKQFGCKDYSDKDSPEINVENEYLDVGFNTQLAAEAMEELLNAPPNFEPTYAHQGSSLKKVSRINTFTNNNSSDLIVTVRRSKRIIKSSKKVNENGTFSLGKCDQNVMEKSVKRNVLFNETNLVNMENKRCSRNTREQRNKSPARNSVEKIVVNRTSSEFNSRDGFLNGNFRNLPISAKRKRNQPSYTSLRSAPDSNKYSEQTFYPIIKSGFSLKRQKVSDTCDDVQKKVKIKGNYSNLPCEKSREDLEVLPDTVGPSSLLKFDFLSFPRKKRTPVWFIHPLNKSNHQSTPLKEVAENNKLSPIKRLAGPLLVYTRRVKSKTEEKVSESLSKHNTDGSLDKENCPKQSSEVDNADNKKFDQGLKSNSKELLVYKRRNKERKVLTKKVSSSPLIKELTRLGYSNSLPEFTPKDSRRKRKGIANVLFSHNLDDTVVKQLKKILTRLGFTEALSCSDATHFIADRFVRTRNMMEAIALGKPIVTPLWLESCKQAGYLIDEKSYILRDAKKEKEIGFSMSVSLARATQNPLLHGRKVFVTPNVKPNKDLVQSLVKAVHGQVVEDTRQSEVKCDTISEDILVLSCEEDYAMCVPFLEKGIAIYSSELLLNGIIIQNLQYKKHRLFKDYIQRNSSKMSVDSL